MHGGCEWRQQRLTAGSSLVCAAQLFSSPSSTARNHQQHPCVCVARGGAGARCCDGWARVRYCLQSTGSLGSRPTAPPASSGQLVCRTVHYFCCTACSTAQRTMRFTSTDSAASKLQKKSTAVDMKRCRPLQAGGGGGRVPMQATGQGMAGWGAARWHQQPTARVYW